MAAEPLALLDLVTALISDPGQKAAFADDPRAWLAEQGHPGLDPVDLRLAVDLAADNLPAPVAAGLVELDPPAGLADADAVAHTLGQVAALDPTEVPELDLGPVDDPWAPEVPLDDLAGWDHLLGPEDGDPAELLRHQEAAGLVEVPDAHDVADLDDLDALEPDDLGDLDAGEPAQPLTASLGDPHTPDVPAWDADADLSGADEPGDLADAAGFGTGHEGAGLVEPLGTDGAFAHDLAPVEGFDGAEDPGADYEPMDVDHVGGDLGGEEPVVPEPDEASELDEDEFDETDFDEGPDVDLHLDLG